MDLHGGNIYKLKRDGIDEMLDYSSNINPLGVPKSFKEAVIKNMDDLERYPDIDYIELRQEIAKYNNTNLENVVVGNGATEVLFLYMKAIEGKKVLIISPTFAEYERAAKSAGKIVNYFPYEKDYSLDIEKLNKFLTDEDIVVLCNPNNPTGKFQDLKKIEKLIEILQKKEKKLFIDEAFIEFMDGWMDKTSFLLENKNIFILRALTKYFAIPGVRLGYGLTYDQELLTKINEVREPWSVNGVAEIAGKVMLNDHEYMKLTDKWILEEKKWFYNELKKIDNIKAFETEVNFILVKLLKDTSRDFREKMLNEKIVVRDASNFKYLDNTFVRLAIKDRERNLKVLEVIKKVVK